jgi:predicted nucleic acid-binding protein
MSGNSLLLDTNIILYFLNGDKTLIPLLEERNLFVSIITEIELLGYSGFSDNELKQTEEFLEICTIINLDSDIKRRAISFRRNQRLKLPDAVILATANCLNTIDYSRF